MSIFIDHSTRVIVQGITGSAGTLHARACRDYGTQLVGGVTPGKGGTRVDDIPVFNTVRQAVEATGATASLVFVPAPYAADAVMEASDAGVDLVVCITEGIPELDMARVRVKIQPAGTRLIGPNGPGLITPGNAKKPGCKIGIMPAAIHAPGRLGVVSRSGTLTYEAVWQLTQLGWGQSTVVGIGGDPIVGTSFVDVLERFEADPETDAVLMIGEIGGSAEEEAAHYFQRQMSKPLAAFIAGRTAPPGRRMGHAGAIVSVMEGGGHSSGGAEAKRDRLKEAGVVLVDSPSDMGRVLVDTALARGISKA